MLGLPLPAMLMRPVTMLGGMAIPLMLLNLGIQLRTLDVTDVVHSGAAVAIRMGGGFACAWAIVGGAGITGVDRAVLLIMGVMPAAVINAVIAERYGADPKLVASSIVIGTVVSLVAIPLVLLTI